MAPRNAILRVLCIAASLGAGTPVLAGESPAKPPVVEDLDEVLVTSKALMQLQQEADAAEDRFYARYNQLNTDRRFDIKCTMRAPLQSRIKERLCQADYFIEAEAAYWRANVDALRDGAAHATIQPDMSLLIHQAAYRKAFTEVLQKNPDLVKLLVEKDQARKRYEAEFKKRMEGHLVLVE